MLLSGVALCFLCLGFGFGWSNRYLAAIGRHSYAIYLFHLMPLHFLTGLVLGLAGPMVVVSLASRGKWTALLLLGKSLKGQKDPAQKPPRLSPAN